MERRGDTHLASMRRIVVSFLLLSILGVIAWWLWDWSGERHERSDPWRIVPANAAAIIEVPSPLSAWERFKSTSQAWNGWSGYPGCHAVDSLMVSLRERFDGQEGTGSIAAASTMVIVLTAAESGFNVTLCWSFADKRAIERFKTLLPDIGTGRSSIAATSSLPAMECTVKNGMLLVSTSTQELTDAVHRLDASASATDSLLTAARNSLGEGSDAHLLVHTGRAQRLLNTWLMPEAMSGLEEVDGWAALDLRARPEATLLSGLLFTPAPPRLLRAAQVQDIGTANMGRVLPTRLTSQWQVHISDPARYHAQAVGTPSDLFDAYGAWAYGALGIATAGSSADSSERAWAVVTTEDPPRALEALSAHCHGCDTLAYRDLRITRSADTSALATVWGTAFERFERPWWCVLGDRVVFSESAGAMREAIDAWTDGSSFQQDVRTGSIFQRYASEAGYTWWCDGAAGINALRPWMKPKGTETADDHAAGWNSIGSCLLQLVPDAPGRFQLTACMAGTGARIATNPGTIAGAEGKWSVSVGAPIIAGPFLLTDHLSRTKQMLVQDKKLRVHLISCTGKVLWQRELDGPILGDAHQVDRYKNGKLQMLFNTAERIYLIDRNGENVTGFPISLPEKASAPLNVFDYDGTKEYRVLVPTVEARLLNFDMNGKAVEGWVSPKTAAVCELPVEHLRVRGKDHLVLVDKNGGIAVLDRRAASRYAPKLNVKDAVRFIGIAPGLEIGETRLIWEDVERNRLRGRLDGPIDTLSMAGDSAIALGLLRYPWFGTVTEGMPHSIEEDIDLDGVRERVIAGGDGRVSVEGIRP